jgi:hypothetical protein
MKQQKHTPEKFWSQWINSDEEDRIKLLQQTMLVKELNEYLKIKFKKTKISKKFILDYASRFVNDYLKDLEQTIYQQKRNKKKN